MNGDWQNLPFQALSNRTLIFRHGWDTVISCPFGLRVTYAPGIRVVVDLPAAYMGHVAGLCADYNGDPSDDLHVPGIVLGTNMPEDALAWAFGHSYLVGSPTECLNAADKMPPPPPSCVTLPTTSTPAHFAHICDILLDPLGPFQLCHEMLAPGPYVQDCIVDVCLGIGPCPMLSLYCETCQLLGGQVFPWRNSSLCSECLGLQYSLSIFAHLGNLVPLLTEVQLLGCCPSQDVSSSLHNTTLRPWTSQCAGFHPSLHSPPDPQPWPILKCQA